MDDADVAIVGGGIAGAARDPSGVQAITAAGEGAEAALAAHRHLEGAAQR